MLGVNACYHGHRAGMFVCVDVETLGELFLYILAMLNKATCQFALHIVHTYAIVPWVIYPYRAICQLPSLYFNSRLSVLRYSFLFERKRGRVS